MAAALYAEDTVWTGKRWEQPKLSATLAEQFDILEALASCTGVMASLLSNKAGAVSDLNNTSWRLEALSSDLSVPDRYRLDLKQLAEDISKQGNARKPEELARALSREDGACRRLLEGLSAELERFGKPESSNIKDRIGSLQSRYENLKESLDYPDRSLLAEKIKVYGDLLDSLERTSPSRLPQILLAILNRLQAADRAKYDRKSRLGLEVAILDGTRTAREFCNETVDGD